MPKSLVELTHSMWPVIIIIIIINRQFLTRRNIAVVVLMRGVGLVCCYGRRTHDHFLGLTVIYFINFMQQYFTHWMTCQIETA